ncbi:MAG TPA: hypothetical protein VJ596_05290 [Gemmatimonadaceae bacterium]|nr:hypothetical protein [Gemmatimonadaceae bacterium]
MADKPHPADTKTATAGVESPPAAPAVRRGPGHRHADVRDTVAEMAARAQEISQEAGSKVAQAMKDVISAAAGLAGFAVESARDLVQYMVRRGQMTQEEADKLIREAEEAHSKRRPAAAGRADAAPAGVATRKPALPAKAAPVAKPAPVVKPTPVAKPALVAKPAPVSKKAATPAKKATPAKTAPKAAARPAATKARVSQPKKTSASARPKAAKKKR